MGHCTTLRQSKLTGSACVVSWNYETHSVEREKLVEALPSTPATKFDLTLAPLLEQLGFPAGASGGVAANGNQILRERNCPLRASTFSDFPLLFQ